MARGPDLSAIIDLLKDGKPFQMTDAQYEKKTGTSLPKDKSYLKNSSALAKVCKERGYTIKVQEKTIFVEKIQ